MAVAISVATLGCGGSSTEVAQQPTGAYTDPVVCQECHADVWKTYRHTGMARSFYPAKPGTMKAHLGTGEPFYHRASERYYTMIERDGRYFQRRHQTDFTGRETNVVEKEIHFVMGSGNHARTYLHLSSRGKLVQLPLGWYADDGGHYAMSPGCDRPNHDGFQRVIAFDCMSCHNGYPELAPAADLPGSPPLYTGNIPGGIDCQRCHGPGEAHVTAARAGSADAIHSTIVNPAQLEPARQMDVCFQCHLETTSRPLPNVLHRFNRGFFSFRPGEALTDFALYFDHAPNSGWDDKFEINHSAYQLSRSACFRAAHHRSVKWQSTKAATIARGAICPRGEPTTLSMR